MEFDKPNLFIEIGQVDSCDNITFPSNAGNTKNTTNSMEDQIVVGCGQGKNVFSGGLFKNMSGMLPTTSNDIDSGNSRWSTEGCELEHFDSETGTVSCKCNHLTNFAVLMSPASTSETDCTFHEIFF
ncbi:AGRL4-like protein [Mya arenaria]|uniref:AGRL4-like protein n=1 Tax=Mya arenaria TaxID=6604 RepID=A0ABY7EGY8_MYAAR|nr:AGRL4-like protein [Mya arenaria]